ncbi:MAG: Ni/Fe hydrogenase subunit alpha [Bryobacteraceae bacterium]
MSARITVNHLARVEGHGGVTLELDGESVSSVRFDVFEGARLLEGLVKGRSWQDVAPILSRICAICSVAHTITSVKATEQAFGIRPSAQTETLRDLLFLGESIESHALHVFLLALPDYLGYPSALAMAADHPGTVALALRLKKLGNAIQEVIGGRAVHPVSVVPGGFTILPGVPALTALHASLQQGVEDCQTALNVLAALPKVNICRSATTFAALRCRGLRGYYRGNEIGVVHNGTREIVKAADYRSLTNEQPVPHSHAKHSTFRGRPFMVGALARLAINADIIDGRCADLMKRLGLRLPSDNPLDNNKAQAVELVLDVEGALRLVERLLEEGVAPEPAVPVRPRAGSGTAITEAPRGLLIHSYTYDEQGAIAAADVITPTALNAASVEDRLRHTAEQNTDRGEPAFTHKLEMVVRAYDPCISCSVHVLRKADAH